MSEQNQAETIAELAVKSAEAGRSPEVYCNQSGPDYLAIPSANCQWLIKSLECYEPTPRRLTGNVRLDNVASFLGYLRVIDQLDDMLRTAWEAECVELEGLPEGVPFFMGAGPDAAAVLNPER